MNRNRGAAMPPTNCDSTYPPLCRRSMRVKELNAWHWIMIITARPRVQSRKGNRFTIGADPTYDNGLRSAKQPFPGGTFLPFDSQQFAVAFRLHRRQRFGAPQQLHHLHHPAEVIDAVPALRHMALHVFPATPRGAA